MGLPPGGMTVLAIVAATMLLSFGAMIANALESAETMRRLKHDAIRLRASYLRKRGRLTPQETRMLRAALEAPTLTHPALRARPSASTREKGEAAEPIPVSILEPPRAAA